MREMTAAELLDKTIEAMVERGENGWFQAEGFYGTARPVHCVLTQASALCESDASWTKVNSVWNEIARRLGYVHLVDLNNSALDFDDCIAKLRQIKAML